MTAVLSLNCHTLRHTDVAQRLNPDRVPETTGPSTSRPQLSVTPADAGSLRVEVSGTLDLTVATVLAGMCFELLAGEGRRLEVDLSGMSYATVDGAAALSQCLLIGRHLPDGLDLVATNERGRALLASMRNAADS